MSAPAPAPGAAPTGMGPAPANNLVAQTVLGSLLTRFKETSASVLKEQKPWSEVLDRTVFSKPENMGEAMTRIKKNLSYFRINYFVIMVATCVVTFLMNPSSLFVLGLLMAGWFYLLFVRTTPVEVAGRVLSDREKLMAMSAISFITIFFLTSVGTVFFSALTFSAAVIAAHGAFREPDNLFVDEVESSQPFLSILTGTATKPAGSAINV